MSTSPQPVTAVVHSPSLHSKLEALVEHIIKTLTTSQLAELKAEFHETLRIAHRHPDDLELIEYLWDFFYDWCVFEKKLVETMDGFSAEDKQHWQEMNEKCHRGLYTVTKTNDAELRLKDLFDDAVLIVPKKFPTDFMGIDRGDIIEGRFIPCVDNDKAFEVLRQPSYHPSEVHSYLKKKVKEFKKAKDPSGFSQWLWSLMGMYLKRKFYPQMPIEKIYDDHSRI